MAAEDYRNGGREGGGIKKKGATMTAEKAMAVAESTATTAWQRIREGGIKI
jgi:hypothetical protein